MAEMTDKNQEELEKKQATAPEDQEQSGKSIIYNALVNDEDDGEKKNIEHLKDFWESLSTFRTAIRHRAR